MGDDLWKPMATPGHHISRAARAMARLGDARLKPLGMSTGQLPVLVALKDGVKLSQRELAHWAKVEQPTMAQMLARMERDGLIQREPDPEDGRSSLISLTETARARQGAARQILTAGNAAAVRGFSPDEVETLLSLLRRVIDNIDAEDA
ncbi:MarR family winged helix-turn-helix transcriptional regulator [Sphingomonas sp.]|uniref:MarR family winged helix-turn-helix transcriptional regulator n=1 Tax=Sphingomonas sp. TaxID=28214 RepID=UPI003D6CD04A